MGGLLLPKTPSPYQQARERLSEALGLLWVRRRSWDEAGSGLWEERAGAALCSCSGGNSPAHGLESFWGFIFFCVSTVRADNPQAKEAMLPQPEKDLK